MHYYIYKTTNKLNGKVYVGQHRTKNLNDGYLGSGTALKAAFKKYGKQHFTKEIILFCKDQNELNKIEQELVTEDFCLRKDNYNLSVGGQGLPITITKGDFTKERYEKWKQSLIIWRENNREFIEASNKRRSETISAQYVTGKRQGTFKDRKHSSSSIEKISQTKRGTGTKESNSQFGSFWITNGMTNKKVKAVDLIPEGYYIGRVIKIRSNEQTSHV